MLNLPSDLANYSFWNKLQSLPFVEGIYLFGSRGRGDARVKSDIDIALDCPNASDLDWQRVLDVIERADTLLMIDIVRYDTLNEGLFKDNIDKNKRVVYEK